MQPRNDVVRLRLTTAEREAWSRAAGGKGRLSEWVRATCNTASIPAGFFGSGEVAAGLTRPLDDVLAEIERDERAGGQTKPGHEPSCSRWMHHRKGVYCGTCKQVN